ncbi:unnamed protein product [Zymoseptoria tritici ST99CH_3D1]|nr:unnamed protein product [Zymoseptoria tritici ST99CH_3D1]
MGAVLALPLLAVPSIGTILTFGASCCGAATCSAVCSACGKCNNSIATRIAYAFLLLLNSLLSWILLTPWAVKKLQAVLLDYVTINCAGHDCFGFAAVHRVNFALGLFHCILAGLLIGVKSSKDTRAALQNGYWGPKIVVWLGLIVGSFLIPNRFFEVWGNYVAFGGAVLFLLLGLVLLVDLAHTFAEFCIDKIEETDSGLWRGVLIGSTLSMFLGSIAMTIVMYIFFAGSGCAMNQSAITINLVLLLTIAVLSIHPTIQASNPRAGLAQAATVSIYCTYLTLSAVAMEPDDKNCNPLIRATGTRKASIFIGAVVTFITCAYTTTRAATYGLALGSGKGSGAIALEEDDHAGGHGLVDTQPESRREMRAEALRRAVESGALPASALDESDDDDDDDDPKTGKYKNDDEKARVQYNYTIYHIIFMLATAWIATLLTQNIGGDKHITKPDDFVPVGRTYWASWVKIKHRPSQETKPPIMYTASFAFFEALWDAGVTHVFVNLGSDHPSILEAIVKGQRETPHKFPKILTCPNEMVAMSLADGFARLTNRPQAVIVHVDVGTQGLGAAVHNASCGRAPVLIFAGLSPVTCEGELRGSRTEYIHWIQDVPDQRQIVGQYCRYSGEIKRGVNVKQLVNRALSFATSEPRGPVYLLGSREAMEEEIEPYSINQAHWTSVTLGGLTPPQVSLIADALIEAERPLLITGYSGRNHSVPAALVDLATAVPGLRVLDTGGSDMCFPSNHPAWLGLRYGVHEAIPKADVILVLDCDVPWIPTQCAPSPTAKIYHLDVDALKQQMPVFYIPALARFRVDAFTAISQLATYTTSTYSTRVQSAPYTERATALQESHKSTITHLQSLAIPEPDNTFQTSYLASRLRALLPEDTIFAIEAVTNAPSIHDQLRPHLPGTWINCGGGGLGWSGGGALGIKLAADEVVGGKGKGKFVCQIVGDGTFLFSVPGSVYWIAERYKIPILTIVLNNQGWNAPRKSLLLVHPEGLGSKVDNEELNISFAPTPDYAGIARAASGGKCWAGRAADVEGLEVKLKEAIEVVKGGRTAVLDAQLGGTVGKYQGE